MTYVSLQVVRVTYVCVPAGGVRGSSAGAAAVASLRGVDGLVSGL